MMEIKIYSLDSCPYCVNLESFLKEKGISFQKIDVVLEKDKLPDFLSGKKEMELPLIEINGKIIKGFNKERLKKVLKI